MSDSAISRQPKMGGCLTSYSRWIPALYRLSGHAVKLPAIDLQQSESRLIELGDSLRKSGIEGQFGYMLSWGQRNVAPFVSASTQQNRDTRTYEYVLFLAPIGTTFTSVLLGKAMKTMHNRPPHSITTDKLRWFLS